MEDDLVVERTSPVHRALNHELGFTYVGAGQQDRAEPLFRRRLAGPALEKSGALRSLALLEMYRGRYAAAVDHLQEAVRQAEVGRNVVTEFRNRAFLARAYAARGDRVRLRAELQRLWTLRETTRMEPFFLAVLGQLLVQSGQISRAELLVEAMAEQINAVNRQDRAARDVLLGEISLARGDTEAALAALELAHTARPDAFTLEPLARANRMSDRLTRAMEVYQKLLAHQELGWEGQDGSVAAPYWLARLAEQRGDTAGAIPHLRVFLERWQHADADLPLLVDARARLQKLDHRPGD